jgi:hypothetical protein
MSSMLMDNSVIAVPGYCTPPVSTWGMSNELEQAAISVESVSGLHMYIYQPTYESTEEFSWENFLKAGSDLAEELARLVTEVCPSQNTAPTKHSTHGTDNSTVSK